jgi:Cft2 family RNA processing exonuclease
VRRSFPDFKLLPFQGRMTEMLTAVLITHFHLDHCAALPYLTEVITPDHQRMQQLGILQAPHCTLNV